MGLSLTPRQESILNEFQNNATVVPNMYGVYIIGAPNMVCCFEMHRPNPNPFKILTGGKVHSTYYEYDPNVKRQLSSHAYAKGSTLTKLKADTKQQDIMRWCCFIAPHLEPVDQDDNGVIKYDKRFAFNLKANDLIKFRIPRGPGVGESTLLDERFAFEINGPLDINMDGSADQADLDQFLASPYDWNLDGLPPGQKDIDDFMYMWENRTIPPQYSTDMYRSGIFKPGTSSHPLANKSKRPMRRAAWSAVYPKSHKVERTTVKSPRQDKK